METTSCPRSGASSVASARELLEERAAAAAAALGEKMRAKAVERAAVAAAKAEEKARAAAEKEAAAAARKAERAAAAAAKASLPKRPRGRPKKVAPTAAAEDDGFETASDADGHELPSGARWAETASDGEAKLCPPAPAIRLDFGEPSPHPTTPMRHIASLQAENAALRARLERAEAALAAIRAALH